MAEVKSTDQTPNFNERCKKQLAVRDTFALTAYSFNPKKLDA